MKRVLDFLLAAIAGMLLFLPALIVALAVKLTSPGPALYWSDRVGRGNALFCMPKFRTMRTGTPVVASDRLGDPRQYLTPIGGFLRRTSLDEIPQIICILNGDMALVGPRPALFNQQDLIGMRTQLGVHKLRPGLTGWAQVNGRDDLDSEKKAAFDRDYLERQSLVFDLRIIVLTVIKVFRQAGVAH